MLKFKGSFINDIFWNMIFRQLLTFLNLNFEFHEWKVSKIFFLAKFSPWTRQKIQFSIWITSHIKTAVKMQKFTLLLLLLKLLMRILKCKNTKVIKWSQLICFSFLIETTFFSIYGRSFCLQASTQKWLMNILSLNRTKRTETWQ